MRRFPIEILIIVLCVVMLAIGWRIYGAGEMGRFGPALHAQRAPSLLEARMLVRYAKRPIYEEEFRMTDNEGVSTLRLSHSRRQRPPDHRDRARRTGLRRQLFLRETRSRRNLAACR